MLPYKYMTLYLDILITCWFFIDSPSEPPPPPAPEQNWADVPSDVVHLTDETFKSFLRKKKHALIMFYAPCKMFEQAGWQLILTPCATCCRGDITLLSVYMYMYVGVPVCKLYLNV